MSLSLSGKEGQDGTTATGAPDALPPVTPVSLSGSLNIRLSFQIAKSRSWRARLFSLPWRPWDRHRWEEVRAGELTETIDQLHAAVHRTPVEPSNPLARTG